MFVNNFIKTPLFEAAEEGSTGTPPVESPNSDVFSRFGIETEGLTAESLADSVFNSPIGKSRIEEVNKQARTQYQSEFFETAKTQSGIAKDVEIKSFEDFTNSLTGVISERLNVKETEVQKANREQAKRLNDYVEKESIWAQKELDMEASFTAKLEQAQKSWDQNAEVGNALRSTENVHESVKDKGLKMHINSFNSLLKDKGLKIVDGKVLYDGTQGNGNEKRYDGDSYYAKNAKNETIEASVSDLAKEYLTSYSLIVENTAVSTGSPLPNAPQASTKTEEPKALTMPKMFSNN